VETEQLGHEKVADFLGRDGIALDAEGLDAVAQRWELLARLLCREEVDLARACAILELGLVTGARWLTCSTPWGDPVQNTRR